MNFLVRVLLPPAHGFEQLLHGLHELREHLPPVHACVLHGSFTVRAAHGMPPCCGFVTIVRVFIFVPPPHFAEHFVKLPHGDNLQWTGQGP